MTQQAVAEPATAAPPSRRQVAVEVGVVWAVLSLVATVRAWSDLRALRLPDPDDATRLVQVRELLGGQWWWDLGMARMGPGGVDMHWSRHMDALLAPVIAALRPLTGMATAELAAIIVVPLGLLLVALVLVSAITRALSSRADAGLYAMAVFGLSVAGLGRFAPGKIDHHGLQIVLVLLVVWLLTARTTPIAAATAGAAGGVSLTVGLETLPLVLAVIAALGIEWGVTGAGDRRRSMAFGSALIAGAVMSSLVFAPPGRILGTQCDVFSLGFFGLVAVPAAGLAALGGSARGTRQRWVWLAGVGAVAVAWFGVVSPECAAGPYAELPRLVRVVWLDLIEEAQTWFEYLGSSPLPALGLLIGPVIALGSLLYAIRRGERPRPTALLAALAAALALTLWEARSAPTALALAAPQLGVVAAALRDRLRLDVLRAVAGAAAIAVMSGFVFSLAAGGGGSGSEGEDTPAAGAAASGECLSPELLDAMASLPPGMVAAEMDFGPDLLVHTDHRVLAASYHRGDEGITVLYELLTAPPAAAEALAAQSAIDYVVVCDGTGISRSWRAGNEVGLLAALLDGSPPGWLHAVFDGGRARIYAVAGG